MKIGQVPEVTLITNSSRLTDSREHVAASNRIITLHAQHPASIHIGIILHGKASPRTVDPPKSPAPNNSSPRYTFYKLIRFLTLYIFLLTCHILSVLQYACHLIKFRLHKRTARGTIQSIQRVKMFQ